MADFKKYFTIPAPHEEVYLALTKATALQLWTGAPVVFEAEPDTEFSLFDDAIVGRNIAFEEFKLIKQEWYFGDDWKDSIVTIKTHAKSANQSQLEVVHTNIPDDAYNDIVEGWNEVYVPSLINFFFED
jgi:activator of HSP90 ATPase